MLKKLMFAATLLATSLGSPAAGAVPYLGGAVGVQNTEGYNGLMATLFGGYGLIVGPCQNFYLAGEIFGDSGSLPLGQHYSRRTNYGLGASFIPGFLFRENIMGYLRIGIETFRYSSSLQRFTGGQLGFGLQTSVTSKLDLRGEYVYTGQGIIQNFGTSRFNFFKLGLLYKFN